MSADVFCITGPDGKILPPAVQATILAKYSRSPESARQIVSEVTEESADKFQEKYVVGYGHNSVAELANLPVCFENISIVASKVVETWQRAGYSEKSTRYQQFSRSSFVTPPGAPPSMKAFAARFYDAYERLMPRMVRICAELTGDDPDNPKRTTRARAFDNIRYLLPAGTGTNVAAVMNLRDVRDMIASLRGRQNPELVELGEKLKVAAESMAPTLMKHTDPDPFHLPVKSVGYLSSNHFDRENPQPYVLLHRPHLMPSAGDENDSFKVLVADQHGMSWRDFCAFMAQRPPWAEVPEVFKSVKVSFEIMMDFGAFRDLQRHRRCEQFVEPLTSNYGYVVPHDIEGTPLEPEYREAMESLESYGDEDVVHNTDLFQYVVPLGYLHRSVFQMDLRELYYIVELRTKPQGHISYRRIAYRMNELMSERLPELMQWCRAVRPDGVGDHT